MSRKSSSRRLLAVLRLALGGPANASVWNWWPLVVWCVSGFLGVFGTQIPRLSLSRAAWLAIFFALTALLMLRAAYKLYAEAHPDFPPHLFIPGPLWVFDHPDPPSKYEAHLIVFHVDFTNRQPTAKVHLTVDLWWTHEKKVQPKRRRFWFDSKKPRPLGPHKLPHLRSDLGSNEMLGRPAVVGGHDPVGGLVAFVPFVIPGLKIEDGELIPEDGLRFFVRLSDGVSGAELDYDLTVPLPWQMAADGSTSRVTTNS